LPGCCAVEGHAANCPRPPAAPAREVRLWWEQTEAYWHLPFYAEAGACCEIMGDTDNMLCGREQLWALRELGEEAGEWSVSDATIDQIRDAMTELKTVGGTEE
jgi:hypothetical protein